MGPDGARLAGDLQGVGAAVVLLRGLEEETQRAGAEAEPVAAGAPALPFGAATVPPGEQHASAFL